MSRFDITRREILHAVGATGAAGLFGVSTAAADQSREPLNRYIVGVTPGNANVARQRADAVYRVLDFGDIGQAVSGWFSDEALEALVNNPNIRYIEQNGELHVHDHTVDEEDGDPTEEQVLPWGIDRVDADVAHHQEETGDGAKITIIDTGIDPSHETLEDNVAGGKAWVNCRGGGCEEDWDDDNDHGTHVAGTASAVDNEVGVVGVATEADLYAAKVLDTRGSGSFDDVAAAIEWSADEGHDVANMSLGGGQSDVVSDACDYAYKEGVLLVASAGNDGEEDSVNYPAAEETVMAISATDDDDDLASFSSQGDEVELAAPGVDVLSSIPGDDYDEFNGTSMAAPHVAGGGAQVIASKGMDNEETRDHLKDTAEDIGLEEEEQGAGLLDVAEALDLDEEEDEDDDEEETTVTVETEAASDVDDSTATLNGELTELEGHDEATVYFEWGESGESLPNATEEQTLDSTGDFDEEVTDLDSDTEYEFRAVAEADDETDNGETLTFTTDEEDDDDEDEETTAPIIDEFELTDTSNPRWARVEVDWAVSDDDGNLDEVTTEVVDWNDTITSSVSGSSSSGTHEHRERDAHGEADVTLTVTDTDGNETSETKSITLG